jgi:hypothetical protein
MVGILILVIGVFFLFKNLGLIAGNVWDVLWPVIVIAIGLRILMRRNRRWDDWHGFGERIHHRFHEHCSCKHEDHENDQQ